MANYIPVYKYINIQVGLIEDLSVEPVVYTRHIPLATSIKKICATPPRSSETLGHEDRPPVRASVRETGKATDEDGRDAEPGAYAGRLDFQAEPFV